MMELVMAVWFGINVGFGAPAIRSLVLLFYGFLTGKEVVQSNFGVVLDRLAVSSIIAQATYIIFF